MMVWSINLLVLAIGFLLVGMFKPQWILFWMEKPGRMPIVILASALFMVSAVMFGEASNEKKQLQQQSVKSAVDSAPVISDSPNEEGTKK